MFGVSSNPNLAWGRSLMARNAIGQSSPAMGENAPIQNARRIEQASGIGTQSGQDNANPLRPTNQNRPPILGQKENGIAEGQQASKGDSGKSERRSAEQTGEKASGALGEDLSLEEKNRVRELKQVDSMVRAHERAHLAAGGRYITSGANFEYVKGPDGNLYAVGGEVSIDTSKESNPEATIAKMQVVRAAALAPADPSGQDRAVAAEATAKENQARAEIIEARAAEAQARREKLEETKEEKTPKAEEVDDKVSRVNETAAAIRPENSDDDTDVIIGGDPAEAKANRKMKPVFYFDKNPIDTYDQIQKFFPTRDTGTLLSVTA